LKELPPRVSNEWTRPRPHREVDRIVTVRTAFPELGAALFGNHLKRQSLGNAENVCDLSGVTTDAEEFKSGHFSHRRKAWTTAASASASRYSSE